MLENAGAVVRYSTQTIELHDESKATHSVKYAVTILKQNAENNASLIIPYDVFVKVKKIEGKLYDKNGKLIKKISKDDIKDFSYYQDFNLYADNRIKYVAPPNIKPPYTVEYEYEIQLNGLFILPSWYSVPGFNVSVEKSTFTVIEKKADLFRAKENLLCNKAIKTGNTTSWQIENYKAQDPENLNQEYSDYFPLVHLAPNNFEFGNYKGNAGTWNKFGKWLHQLNQGRDILPEKTVSGITELTKNAETDYEKASIIYYYMQNRTRYVSIQLGIGGWQPFNAQTVNKNGYGDCKALSNYMFALLKAVNIKSHYAIVFAGTDEQNIDVTFPSNQFNHAILCIPAPKDTIWLECTSQTAPFGYIGSFTDNRNVLLITPEGGKIARTTKYTGKNNIKSSISFIKIDDSGNASGKSEISYKNIFFDQVSSMIGLTFDEMRKSLKAKMEYSNIEFSEIQYSMEKKRFPQATEKIDFTLKNYASVSNQRLFLPLNFIKKEEITLKKSENRKTDFTCPLFGIEKDSLVFEIPENYTPEYLPEKIKIETEFGSYETDIKFENNKLYYFRKTIFEKKKYKSEKYNDFIDFMIIINKKDNEDAIFIKNT